MKAPPLAKNYGSLTPEERYWLILAASGRGDVAERDRLVRASGTITLSMQDHTPYAHAFDELALQAFLELLEEAARYREHFERWNLVNRLKLDEEVDSQNGEDGPERDSHEEADNDAAADEPASERYLDLTLASGYVLRGKAEGWKLFCARHNTLPYLLWEMLPGFDRLQRELVLAEQIAFLPEGFLRWLNRIRPKGEPELTELSLTAETIAKANEAYFRERVRWWGG